MVRIAGFVLAVVLMFCVLNARGQTLLDGYGMIGGVVKDVNSSPLADVEVTACEANTDNPIEGAQDSTNSQGQYTLFIPMDGQDEVVVDVWARKWHGRELFIPADSSGRHVRFLQADTLHFELRRQAQPITGYITSLEEPQAPIESVYVWTQVGDRTIADTSLESGYYHLNLLEADTYDIHFDHWDFVDTVAQVTIGTDWDYPYYLDMQMQQVVWNVAVDGDDAGRGTRGSPFETIRHALDYASTDDTVLVWPGAYRGTDNLEFQIEFRQLVIKSAEGAESCSLVCFGQPPVQQHAFLFKNVGPEMVLDGFLIRDGYNSIGGAIACFENGSPTLANLIFENNAASLYGGALAIDDESHPIVRNCLFVLNNAPNGGAISVTNESFPTVDSCIIVDNYATTGNGGGIFVDDSFPLVENCTVVRNSVGLYREGGGIYIEDNVGPDVVVRKSILWHNVPDGIYTVNSNWAVENCDVQGDPVWGPDNLNYHPLFCDPDADDFRLGMNSPCIDYPVDGEYIGALEPCSDSISIIYGTVSDTEDPPSPIDDVTVGGACYNGPSDSTTTGIDGYYELVIAWGIVDTSDVSFSHSSYQSITVDSVIYTPGYSTELNVALEAGGCDYIPGDCDYNGTPLELTDVTTMICTYRGMCPNPYTCPCNTIGDEFPATADPDGNCVANEITDVTTEICAYRGTCEVAGCPDCPGTPGILSAYENGSQPAPTLKSRAVTGQESTGD